jgi:hypothetical protein
VLDTNLSEGAKFSRLVLDEALSQLSSKPHAAQAAIKQPLCALVVPQVLAHAGMIAASSTKEAMALGPIVNGFLVALDSLAETKSEALAETEVCWVFILASEIT